MTATHARRTCPACARRYGGLIAEDCPICQGTGALALGAAALSQHTAPAVARAVELYLELKAQDAGPLPAAERGDALEAAVLDLRSAGVLAHGQDPTSPGRPGTNRPTAERDATRYTAQLTGRPVLATVPAHLAAPTIPLLTARPDRVTAHASANGHRAHLARIADPIRPTGPDLLDLDAERRTVDHAARVIAGATAHLTRKRARTA